MDRMRGGSNKLRDQTVAEKYGIARMKLTRNCKYQSRNVVHFPGVICLVVGLSLWIPVASGSGADDFFRVNRRMASVPIGNSPPGRSGGSQPPLILPSPSHPFPPAQKSPPPPPVLPPPPPQPIPTKPSSSPPMESPPPSPQSSEIPNPIISANATASASAPMPVSSTPPSPPPPPYSLKSPASTEVQRNAWDRSEVAGVVIASVAALLQVVVVAYLLVKRRQMLAMVEEYDSSGRDYEEHESDK